MSRAPVADCLGLEPGSAHPPQVPLQGTWGLYLQPSDQAQAATRTLVEKPGGPKALAGAGPEPLVPYNHRTHAAVTGQAHHTAPLPVLSMDLPLSSESSSVFSRSLSIGESLTGPLTFQGSNTNTLCPPGDEHTLSLLQSLMHAPTQPPAVRAPHAASVQDTPKNGQVTAEHKPGTFPRAAAPGAPNQADQATPYAQPFSSGHGYGAGGPAAAPQLCASTGRRAEPFSDPGSTSSHGSMLGAPLSTTASLRPDVPLLGKTLAATAKLPLDVLAMLPPLVVQPLDVGMLASMQPPPQPPPLLPVPQDYREALLYAAAGHPQLQGLHGLQWQQLLFKAGQAMFKSGGLPMEHNAATATAAAAAAVAAAAALPGLGPGGLALVGNTGSSLQPRTAVEPNGPHGGEDAVRQGAQPAGLPGPAGSLVSSVGDGDARLKGSPVKRPAGVMERAATAALDPDLHPEEKGTQDLRQIGREGGAEEELGEDEEEDEDEVSTGSGVDTRQQRNRKRRAPPRRAGRGAKKENCRERNRTAQRRFRERQKDMIRSLQETVQQQGSLIRELKRRLSAYEEVGDPEEAEQ
ncbi:hypothetical protein Agub_g11988 [Astrephomene gubernaculifera]|uniref:BZIP domain-containing protein n=1 Tax=Astrephomene gubernaculifera TaxID=47775 RepID=A0AAD3DZI0_9CHLO|nr:hypothetical protein Agub_g11988 [Astrephomene gubernaculifera]